MTRDEAVAELARRYRVRVVLEIQHGERAANMHGATMAASSAELGAVVGTLLEHMLRRVLERLERLDA